MRQAFDTISLAIATAAAFAGMHWSMQNADPSHGAMWKQVLATSVAYGLFLGVMTVALWARWRWLRRDQVYRPRPGWAGYLLFATVLVHVGAALMHAWVRRDGVLRSMWPGPLRRSN